MSDFVVIAFAHPDPRAAPRARYRRARQVFRAACGLDATDLQNVIRYRDALGAMEAAERDYLAALRESRRP